MVFLRRSRQGCMWLVTEAMLRGYMVEVFLKMYSENNIWKAVSGSDSCFLSVLEAWYTLG